MNRLITAAEHGTTYFASQTFYGIGVEVLVAGEWVGVGDLEEGAEVEAVRLFDCDGERSRTCRTLDQVEAERVEWVGIL